MEFVISYASTNYIQKAAARIVDARIRIMCRVEIERSDDEITCAVRYTISVGVPTLSQYTLACMYDTFLGRRMLSKCNNYTYITRTKYVDTL